MTVLTGLERAVAHPDRVRGWGRCGLLLHPASVDRHFRPALEVLLEAGLELGALLGPQHGILGQTQDNMVEWQGFVHPRLGVPVHSLYGEVRKPTPEMLAGLETLVVDLQDVGARYYTFAHTLTLCMEACAVADVRVVVLDRPNPLGGVIREGPILEEAYRSFVGLLPVPIRHGLTLGEIARLAARRTGDAAPELEVVPMEGWRREMLAPSTGLPWVLPSPNMPTFETAVVYPGICLLEGTTLSEGRGTTRPFELLGAPWLEGEALARRLRQEDLPGASFRPTHFEPTFQKHARRLCGGIQIHVTDPDSYRPVRTGLAILRAALELAPGQRLWNDPPYEYETAKRPIDILAGGEGPRRMLEAGTPLEEMEAAWQGGLARFEETSEEVRLY